MGECGCIYTIVVTQVRVDNYLKCTHEPAGCTTAEDETYISDKV